jgi:hypothetical protein
MGVRAAHAALALSISCRPFTVAEPSVDRTTVKVEAAGRRQQVHVTRTRKDIPWSVSDCLLSVSGWLAACC